MDKITKERIRKLKKEQRYDDIFAEFGTKVYKSKIPHKYKKQELKKLTKEGRYEDIFSKYGKNEYEKTLNRAMYNEIKGARGTISAWLWKIKQHIKSIGIKNTLMLSAGETVNREKNQMEFSDIQIFMKVMDDMQQNMASDAARKLNEINPKYNARTMVATMGEDGYFEIADIERNIIETNHMVTLVDVPSDKLTLVLDPTNPGIGIYINGKIIIINSAVKDEPVEYKSKELSEALIIKGGLDGLANVTMDYIKSFRKSKLTQEEIENKYGLEAQNRALKEVRAREKVEEIFAEQEKSEQSKVRNEIKIELPKIELPKFNVENNIDRDKEIVY